MRGQSNLLATIHQVKLHGFVLRSLKQRSHANAVIHSLGRLVSLLTSFRIFGLLGSSSIIIVIVIVVFFVFVVVGGVGVVGSGDIVIVIIVILLIFESWLSVSFSLACSNQGVGHSL